MRRRAVAQGVIVGVGAVASLVACDSTDSEVTGASVQIVNSCGFDVVVTGDVADEVPFLESDVVSTTIPAAGSSTLAFPNSTVAVFLKVESAESRGPYALIAVQVQLPSPQMPDGVLDLKGPACPDPAADWSADE